MAVEDAKKRSTRVSILPQGGIAFLLDSLDMKVHVHVSGVDAAGGAYCADTRNTELCSDRNLFPDNLQRICMNRDFPLIPIRSTPGQFKSGQMTGRVTATMAVCED
jgi:hypothetical protein